MDFTPNVAVGLQNLLSNRPAGCSCPQDLADRFRRVLGGDETLCEVHDSGTIAVNLAKERAAIELDAARAERAIAIAARDGLRELYEPQSATPIGDDVSIVGILHRELGGLTNQTTEQL